ncbi:unnamed protein product [Sympodiomycopsis kandeliae]
MAASQDMDFVSDRSSCQSLGSANQHTQQDRETMLGQCLSKLYTLHTAGVDTKNERNAIILSLQSRLEDAYPGAGLKLAPFGSTINGLQTKSSDFDLTIVDPSRPKGKWSLREDVKPLKTDIAQDYLPNWSFELPAMVQCLHIGSYPW